VRVAKLLLVLPGLALVLAACGSVHAGTASPDAASSVGTTAPAAVTWSTIQLGLNDVTVHLASSGRVLLIPVQAPFGDKTCLRDFTARLTAFGKTAAYVTINYQAALTPGPDGLAGYGCPPGTTRTVQIKLPGPLGRRQVILDHTETFWAASTTRLTLCSTAGTLCHHVATKPPPASCTDVSYGWAMAATYPPMHSDYGVVGCDGRWLVLNVGWPGGPVGCDGPTCNPDSTTTHWFFRASKQGWIVVADTLTAGCTHVHQEAPKFPTALCASLPAVGPDAKTQG